MRDFVPVRRLGREDAKEALSIFQKGRPLLPEIVLTGRKAASSLFS
jgi:hypothetical protein